MGIEIIKEFFPKELETVKKELDNLRQIWSNSFKRAPRLTCVYAMLFLAIGLATGFIVHDWIHNCGTNTIPAHPTPQNQTNFFLSPQTTNQHTLPNDCQLDENANIKLCHSVIYGNGIGITTRESDKISADKSVFSNNGIAIAPGKTPPAVHIETPQSKIKSAFNQAATANCAAIYKIHAPSSIKNEFEVHHFPLYIGYQSSTHKVSLEKIDCIVPEQY